MTEVRCGQCGGTVLHEAGARPDGSPACCPRCGSSVQVIAEGKQVEAGSGGALAPSPYRTGTIVLEAEPAVKPRMSAPEPPEVEVKVQGFLTLDGAAPDQADFRLRGDATVVGREEGQIVVDDPAVSGRHFQVEERGSEFYVRDLGSSNGTFLNGRQVESAKLQTGDRIRAGGTVLAFSVRHVIPM